MIGNDVMWKVAQRIVIDEAGCWLWQGSKDPRGYGRMSVLVDPTLRQPRAPSAGHARGQHPGLADQRRGRQQGEDALRQRA